VQSLARRGQRVDVLSQELVGDPELMTFDETFVIDGACDIGEALFQCRQGLQIGERSRIQDFSGQCQVLPPGGTQNRM